jgi:WD40 repeat protein
VDNVTEVTQLARWDRGEVHRIFLSPDGRVLAAASLFGVQLLEVPGLTVVDIIPTEESVERIAFSPDSSQIAGITTRGEVFLWDLQEGANVWSLRACGNIEYSSYCDFASIYFSPDGKTLAVLAYDVLLLDTIDGSVIATIEGDRNKWADSLSFLSDGSLLAAGAGDGGVIEVWRLSDGTVLQRMEHSTEQPPWDIAFSPDGKMLVSCGRGLTRVWQVNGGNLLAEFKHSFSGPSSLECLYAFSSDSAFFTTVASEEQIEVVKTDDWGERDRLDLITEAGQRLYLAGLAVTADGMVITSDPGWKGRIALWDKGVIKRWIAKDPSVTSLAFSPDGETLAVGYSDGLALAYRVSDGDLLLGLAPERSGWGETTVAFSIDGQRLYHITPDGTINIWDIDSGTIMQTHTWEGDSPIKVDVSPDGEIIAAFVPTIHRPELRLWKIDSLEPFVTLTGQEDPLMMAFTPDGQYLVVVYEGIGPFVAMYRVSDGELIWETEAEFMPSYTTMFSQTFFTISPNNQLLAVQMKENEVSVYRLNDGNLEYTFMASSKREEGTGRAVIPRRVGVSCLSYSPDGNLLVVGVRSPSLQFRRASDGVQLHALQFTTRYFSAIRSLLHKPQVHA